MIIIRTAINRMYHVLEKFPFSLSSENGFALDIDLAVRSRRQPAVHLLG